LLIRKFEDTEEQNADTLLGSLNLGIKNKWLIDKEPADAQGKLSFALKYIAIEPGKLYPVRRCEHAEATIVLEGQGTIRNGKGEFEIKPGDVAIVRQGEMYSLINSGKTDLKIMCCIDLRS